MTKAQLKRITFASVFEFACGELGLKPWEFYDMSPGEYSIYAHGYFLRRDRDHEGLRKIYRLLYNAHFKNPIRSDETLMSHWPLLTDPESRRDAIMTPAKMKKIWDQQQAIIKKNEHGRT